MTVKASFLRAKNEVKKTLKTKKIGPQFADAFIALIVAIFQRIKLAFFQTYNYLFTKLNYFLPLPFADKLLNPEMITKAKAKAKAKAKETKEA
jgi:hypothetical protein